MKALWIVAETDAGKLVRIERDEHGRRSVSGVLRDGSSWDGTLRLAPAVEHEAAVLAEQVWPDPHCTVCGNGTFGADVCGVCKREARRA